MGYTDYIKALLSPMRVYRLEDGFGAAEIQALGNALDGINHFVEGFERECTVPYAMSYGLSMYESVFPLVKVENDAAQRRQSIMDLMQVGSSSFSVDAVNKILSACGTNAAVSETEDWYTVEVSFSEISGIPTNIQAIKTLIEETIPCHLDVRYVYPCTSWEVLESAFPTIGDIKSAEMTFERLERYPL